MTVSAAGGSMLATLMALVGAAAWPGGEAPIDPGLESLDRMQRLRAVERLAISEATSPGATAELRAGLLPLLTDSDQAVRGAAARVLARAGAAEATAAALAWVKAPSPVDRPIGLAILRESGTLPPDARAAVERCVRDADQVIRLAALDVLARHGPAPSFSALMAALDDEQREVRLRAIRLLEEAGDRRATVALLGRLADSDRQVNLDAIHALGALGDAGAAPALMRLIQTGSDDLRTAAIDAVGQLGLAAAVPLLAPLARRRPVDELGRRALLALGQIGNDTAVTVLIDRLREPPIGEEVKEALRRAGGKAVPLLVAAIDNRGGTIRASTATTTAAAAILGAIGDRRASAVLADLVDRHSPAALPALQALAALRDPEGLFVAVRAARDPDPEIRRAAFDTLSAIGDARGTVALEQGLGDPDLGARLAALRLAARLGDGGFAAQVLPGLTVESDEQRVQSLTTLAALLGDVAPPGATTALLAAARALDQRPTSAATLAEADLLGDVLERVAAPATVATLESSLLAATANARVPLVRALAAARAAGAPLSPHVIQRLLELVAQDGELGEAAADALAAVDLRASSESALARAFDLAGAAVRARLCPALARLGTPATRTRLVELLGDDLQEEQVVAAAAWASATVDDPRLTAALQRLSQSARAAVAANARAALSPRPSAPRPPPPASTALRLLAPGGLGPLPRRWVLVRAGNLPPLWAMTGARGLLRLFGLPPGPVTVGPADPMISISVR